MKFLDAILFWKTLNDWIRDGSRIYEFGENQTMAWAYLWGKDGCREELILFHEELDFDNSDLLVGD